MRPARALRAAVAAAVLLGESASLVRAAAPDDRSAISREVERALEAKTPPPTGVVLPGPVDPETYVIGPGDSFELHFRAPISETLPLRVSPEGTLYLPGTGVLQVSGLSLTELRQRVGAAVRQRTRGVLWDLELVAARRLRVYLTGEVEKPGPIEVSATSRVSDALPPAALSDKSSRRNVRVLRRDGSIVIADLELFLRRGDNALNPYLLDGDVVNVPVAVEFVDILGAVAHPGRYELGPQDSLRSFLELAGGPLPATLVDHALLLRWHTTTESESSFFSLNDVYGGTFNPALREGDRVYLYFLPSYHEVFQATVLGEVERPGSYPIAQGRTRISELVRAAGGFRARADLASIRIYRAFRLAQEKDPELDRLAGLSRTEMTESEYEILRSRLFARREDFRLDWNRIARDPQLDLLVSDGDIVRVDPIFPAVRVEGEVRRPGLIDFDPKRSVQDYVRLAGGFSNRASRGKVLITRTVTGQTLPARDVGTLAAGDMIWVPERVQRPLLEQLIPILTAAAQVATILIAVRR